MRTLRPAGKLEELTHEMDRYHWNVLVLCVALKETLVRCHLMTVTRFFSVGKRTDMNLKLVFYYIKTWQVQSWDADQCPAD